MAGAPSVRTIPPGVPFVDALAAGLCARLGDDPLALTGSLVLLPTRRACRALTEAFLRHSGGEALLLPQMLPIGDMEDELSPLDEPVMAAAVELPPAIPALRRRVLLARLILANPDLWRHGRVSPAQATQLADGLADFLDQVQIEQLSFDGLRDLVPERYASHWQITLEFLTILTTHWPSILDEQDCMDPAMRRNRLIEARCEAWRADPPQMPVIAAGSTGTIPATAELLSIVAGLPDGIVVLPGLDTNLDADDADALPATHPQAGMARLVRRLGIAPGDVAPWPAPGLAGTPPARATLTQAAFCPPGIEAAAIVPEEITTALERVRLIACPGPREEAGVIALAMRRALETPGRTASLVTPDRALARRVAAELRRWGIEIDDSAGTKLSHSPAGLFLRLSVAFAAERAAPVPLLSLLKHPLSSFGMEPASFRANVRRLERAALRGPRPAPGFEGLRSLVERHEAAGDLLPWIDALAALAAPFMDAIGQAEIKVADLVSLHAAFAEALAGTPGEDGAQRLWVGEAGEAAAGFIAQLGEAAESYAPISGADYAALFEVLMAPEVVRPRYGLHPRLHIWGLLEARMQHADLVCLGGLNEGTWPPEAHADPWLSRPMRGDFGLPQPERRIGLTAHDFVQAFSAPEVMLTRAERVDGTPTVPSRWLLRLENVIDGAGLDGAAILAKAGHDDNWLGWQAAADRPDRVQPVAPPEPRPPIKARPRGLSVTQVETWMRDPYAIYARHVLRLRPLDAIDSPPGAADRGTVIHQAIEDFLHAWPDALPDDILSELLAAGRHAFGADLLALPGVRAFWWPRFERIAAWLAVQEPLYRNRVAEIRSEITGRLVLPGPAGDFTLTAKADRIDRLKSGGLAIIDYKTGALPNKKEIREGYAPQLPLEAAIAAAGGFDGIPAASVEELAFWRLSGGDPPGQEEPVGDDIEALATQARDGLAGLVAEFDAPDTPYLSRPDPNRPPRFPEYDHLARVQEWSVPGSGDGE
ncbi:MAG: double-strand break repair protein AddB [Alphaproteobacteria bacterium]